MAAPARARPSAVRSHPASSAGLADSRLPLVSFPSPPFLSNFPGPLAVPAVISADVTGTPGPPLSPNVPRFHPPKWPMKDPRRRSPGCTPDKTPGVTAKEVPASPELPGSARTEPDRTGPRSPSRRRTAAPPSASPPELSYPDPRHKGKPGLGPPAMSQTSDNAPPRPAPPPQEAGLRLPREREPVAPSPLLPGLERWPLSRWISLLFLYRPAVGVGG